MGSAAMATPSLVPRADDDGGSIGINTKRWSAAFFAGRITSRGQTLGLKYFVSDTPTRYNMTGMASGVRPEDGDMVFQYLPPGLFLVVDQNNLGNQSGYYAIASETELSGYIQATSGFGTGITLEYQDISFEPSGSGLTLFSTLANSPIFTVGASGNVYFDALTSGKVLVLDDNNLLTTSPVTTGELSCLVGASGNIQEQFNTLYTGAFPVPGAINLSIQFNDSGLFGGDINFKFNKSGCFGYSPSGLRGPLDIYRPLSSLATSGSAYITGVAGSAYTNASVFYNVYPYLIISNQRYYSTVPLSGNSVVSGTHNIQVYWFGQSGASGYRVIGSGATNVVYDTVGTSFIDSGYSNATGELLPTYGGANFYLDFLSNLYLSGQMFINGFRVLTTKDLASGSGNGTGIVFYNDTYVVKTTGNQTISGHKSFYDETYFQSGIGIRTTTLRGPLDIGVASGFASPPSGLSITPTTGFQYQLWDSTGTLTFEVYAFINSGEYTFYSSGISGNFPLSGTYDWFKVDLSWTASTGTVSGYKVVFGGDTTNDRYRNYYLTTTGTTLSYGLSGQIPIFESPIVVISPTGTQINLYVNNSGDLITANDIYCRYLYTNAVVLLASHISGHLFDLELTNTGAVAYYNNSSVLDFGNTNLIGNWTVNGHAIATGASSSTDANTLNGQSGSYYLNAGNLTGVATGIIYPSISKGIILCAGFVPTGIGADIAEFPIPYDADGLTSVTWNVHRATLRVQASGGAPSVRLEKSTGTGAFSPTTIGTITFPTGAYEASVTSGLGTIASAQKVRFNVLNIDTALYWTILMEISRN